MITAIFALFVISSCVAHVPLDNGDNLEYLHRARRATAEEITRLRNMSPSDRPNCKPGATVPNTRVDTTQRLANLRAKFNNPTIHGYLIPSEDAHQSEYPSDYDLRREFISGMSGSYGKAVVLGNKAALWTDGRYFLQAEDELDCNWILMKQGEVGVPSVTEWVMANLASGQKLGASPFLIGSSLWKEMSKTLAASGIQMTEVHSDLIDQIWLTNRPPQPNSAINALPMQFAGRRWQDKIIDMQTAMAEKGADILIVTGLDETAWLFNLRASDISYNPFFLSYAVVNRATNVTRLYLKDHISKIRQEPTDEETKENVQTHLNTGNDGTCTGRTGMCVEVKSYDENTLLSDIHAAVSSSPGKVWMSFTCNFAIYGRVLTAAGNSGEDKIHQANTPAALQKAQKNEVERNCMKESHIRDAVAVITFMAKLEKEVKEGKHWTEVSAAADLKQHRMRQKYNRGLSFPSISAVGSNGAVIHYFPTNLTDKKLTTSDMYLLDSGGQYLDGTTDVTRTFHFGSPTDYEKETYTRVLKGHVNLAVMAWPSNMYVACSNNTTIMGIPMGKLKSCNNFSTKYEFIDDAFWEPYRGREIDAIARQPLWEVGLQYRHGTGHGIGMYLSVHEGPGRISLSHSSFVHDEPLNEHQFFSDEPGYYEDGKFGIRLENIVMIKKVKTKYQFPGTTFFGFETITLVPYEPNLIVKELLSQQQIDWINAYHAKVQSTIGPLVANDAEASKWLSSRTKTIQFDQVGTASSTVVSLTLMLVSFVFCIFV